MQTTTLADIKNAILFDLSIKAKAAKAAHKNAAPFHALIDAVKVATTKDEAWAISDEALDLI